MEQLLIAILGAISIWLTQQKREHWKKFACIFGLIGQPFWFYATFASEQWGMFALSIVYTYTWLLGLKNYWFANNYNKDSAQI